MVLDIRTLVITNFYYSLLIAILFAISYNGFTGQVRASIKTLSNAMFMSTIGWLFLGLRGYIPDFHSILWGNLASILGLLELFNVIRVFDGKSTKRRLLYPLALLFIVANMYYYVINNLPSIRIAIISLSSTVFCSIIVYAIFNRPNYTSKIRSWCGIAFIVFAIISFTRVIDSFFINFGEYTLLSNTLLQTYYFVIIFLAVFMMTFAFILMCTHRFQDELKRQAIIDPVTNLYNRFGIEQYLQGKIDESVKNSKPLCAIVIDIDEFRKFNDQYGLVAGDLVLQKMAKILLNHTGNEDIPGRLGGDEFILILSQTDLPSGRKIADKIAQEIHQHPFEMDQKKLTLNISLGVAILDPEYPEYNQLIKNAHHELFKARTHSDELYAT